MIPVGGACLLPMRFGRVWVTRLGRIDGLQVLSPYFADIVPLQEQALRGDFPHCWFALSRGCVVNLAPVHLVDIFS